MEVWVFTASFLLSTLLLLSVFYPFRSKKYSNRLPPGSLGLPLIGQTLEYLKAFRDDKIEEWHRKNIAKYGPIWKSRLLGHPTVVLHGIGANKFVNTCDTKLLTSKQPPSLGRIFGSKSIIELNGDDHKRVRDVLVSFLRLDTLKQYVSKVDEETQNHIETHWRGKAEVKVQPLIKVLTFNLICSLVFGIEKGAKRENYLPFFQRMFDAIVALPINFPFGVFNRGLKARMNLVSMFVDLLQEKREALKEQKKQSGFCNDFIMSMLSVGDDNDSSTMMSDEEIIDNTITVMVAGYYTTASVLTCLVKLLANNKSIYSTLAQENEEISKSKAPGEALTWEDLSKMKYTWRLASEMLRINSPANVTFRRAAQDIDYEGYIIPKGWQVMLSSSMTHMDDSIFQNPTMFDPTRFENNAPSPPSFSYLPFGIGPRMCPGMEFAKMEILILIHRLVTQFTFELVDKDESFKRIPFPEFDQGLLVQIKPI